MASELINHSFLLIPLDLKAEARNENPRACTQVKSGRPNTGTIKRYQPNLMNNSDINIKIKNIPAIAKNAANSLPITYLLLKLHFQIHR